MVSRQSAVVGPRVDRPRPAEPVALREPEPLLDPVVSVVADPVAPLPEAIVMPEPLALPEPVIVPEPVVVPKPVVVSEPSKPIELPQPTIRPAGGDAVPSMAPAHAPTVAKEQERVSFKDLADSLLGAMTATQEALAQTAADASAKPVVAEPLVRESAVRAPAVTAALELETMLKSLEETPVVTPTLEESVAPTSEKAEPALTLESATSSPAPTPAAPQHPAAETAKPAAPAMPQGFEGLKFPNDGVLTGQWMEFLSQMSTTK